MEKAKHENATSPRKSPLFPEKCPLFPEKRPLFPEKRPLFFGVQVKLQADLVVQ